MMERSGRACRLTGRRGDQPGKRVLAALRGCVMERVAAHRRFSPDPCALMGRSLRLRYH
jgi:hypothetical protein